MVRVIFDPDRGQRVPVLVWARAIAPAAERQLRAIASQPYVVDHVAAMPDVHVAEGVAVGTVFATEHAVVPGALGGDLGCGMCAVRFPFPAASLGRAELRRILSALGRAIPVGDAVHRGKGVPLPDPLREAALSTHALCRARDRIAPKHLGTLGGGNHFLELDRDAGGDLWVMVHSGSRGVGAAVAAHHRRAAEALGAADGLAALPADADAGRAYVEDVAVALSFARANRDALLARAAEVVAEATGVEAEFESAVDVHHNFVAREHHGGREVWVHRKGATSARAGEYGLIPGSMGTASYLVRGLGSEASFGSCSHGAGRVMSRREARERIDPGALGRAMRRVVFDEARLADLVEEAPAAYRDVAEVLDDQRDLVESVLRLEPIAVLKG